MSISTCLYPLYVQPKMSKEELDKIRLLPPLTRAMPEEDRDALHQNLHLENKVSEWVSE